MAKFVIQANFGNAMNIAQALCQLEIGVVAQAALKRGNDLCLVQPHTAWSTHCQNKREAEFLVVAGVEVLNLCKLFR